MSERDIRTILQDATAAAVVTINAMEQKNAKLRTTVSRVLWEFGACDDRCARLKAPVDTRKCDCGLAEERKEADDALKDAAEPVGKISPRAALDPNAWLCGCGYYSYLHDDICSKCGRARVAAEPAGESETKA